MNIKSYIREVPDWPIEGVSFKDITTLLQDSNALKYVIDKMTEPFLNKKIDKVVAIESRGFLLATPIAYKIGCGISLVRKKDKLPFKTIKESYKKEYGFDMLIMHQDTIVKDEKILIIDDIIATGGTIETTIKLVKRLGGKVVGISSIVDLPFLGGSKKLKKYHLHYLVSYDEE